MIEFLYEYGLFFAKTATLVIAIALVMVIILAVASRKHPHAKETIEIKKLNEKYDDMAMALQSSMLHKAELKSLHKQKKQSEKKQSKQKNPEPQEKKRIFVLNFHGDIRASAVASLREEITAVMTVVRDQDEVFVRLESGGGIVHAYGLAASQLMRLRERGIHLTVAVDKIAASGGYMMACVGNRILAAPFAIIGSIGVIAQVPNFHKLLKKFDVDYEQFTAGEFKRTVTMFGENTEEAKSKFMQEIEDIHLLFKEFIAKHRPSVDIMQVSTGESWPGTRALVNNLVDELKTSDDYLLEQSHSADLYEISYVAKKSIMEKIGVQFQKTMDQWQWSRARS